MRPFDGRLVVAVVVAAMFATLVGLALTYEYEVRLVPLVIGVPALLLSLWQVRVELAVRQSGSQSSPTAAEREENAHRTALVWLFLFTGLLLFGGLLAGGTIAVVAAQRYWLKESWRTAVCGGAIAVFLVHVCFGWGFGFELFPGLILQWTTH